MLKKGVLNNKQWSGNFISEKLAHKQKMQSLIQNPSVPEVMSKFLSDKQFVKSDG